VGGRPTPAIGCAAGLERLAMLLDEMPQNGIDVAVVAIGDSVSDYALQQAARLRRQGLSVVHCGGGSAKRQFKMADREHARYVAVIGEDEMQTNSVTLKKMATGEQQQLPAEQVATAISD